MFIKGLNKAEIADTITWIVETFSNPAIKSRPCVFLSHKREDKSSCRIIAKYLADAGIDYYLDENDDALRIASTTGDPVKITESIKKGIRESTHMMVVISEKTYKSLWVPFEVGYGHASILDPDKSEFERDRIKLSVLTLKDIAEKTLPDYLRIGYVIRGTLSLNEYISKISGILEKSLINESRIYPHHKQVHPLDNILNWKL